MPKGKTTKPEESKPVDPVAKIVDRIIELQFGSLPQFQQKTEQAAAQLRQSENDIVACNGRIAEMQKFAVDSLEVEPEALQEMVQSRAQAMAAEAQAAQGPPVGAPEEEEAGKEEKSTD